MKQQIKKGFSFSFFNLLAFFSLWFYYSAPHPFPSYIIYLSCSFQLDDMLLGQLSLLTFLTLPLLVPGVYFGGVF